MGALAAGLAVFALGVWALEPRFEIDSPSLVDDWYAVVRASDRLDDLLATGTPEESRFRPAWTVWSYLQWHTFDAPDGLVGPNAWNLARLAILVAGLALLALLTLPPPRRRTEALLRGVLAAVPAFLVLTVPKFARDLARFGTQEPLLVGGMALGGGLLVLAVRDLLREPPVRRVRLVALVVSGSLLWLAGVYQKEASLAALPFLAVLGLACWRRRGLWPALDRPTRRTVAAIGVVIVLPLVHVAIESARIAARGELVYGAKVDAGRGVVRGLELLYDFSSEVFSPDARRVLVVALLLTAAVALHRRRLDALALAALASGALSLVVAAQAGVFASRYYLPAYALAGVAVARALAALPAIVQVVGVVVLLVTFLPASESRHEVRAWTEGELAGEALVESLAELDGRGCRLAVAGVDAETTRALASLVARARTSTVAACEAGDVFVLRPNDEGFALVEACATGALVRSGRYELEGGEVEVHRCSRLAEEPVRDPVHGPLPPPELVEARLLVPSR